MQLKVCSEEKKSLLELAIQEFGKTVHCNKTKKFNAERNKQTAELYLSLCQQTENSCIKLVENIRDNPQASKARAYFLLFYGEYRAAIHEYSKIIERKAQDHEAYGYRALSYFKLDRLEEA